MMRKMRIFAAGALILLISCGDPVAPEACRVQGGNARVTAGGLSASDTTYPAWQTAWRERVANVIETAPADSVLMLSVQLSGGLAAYTAAVEATGGTVVEGTAAKDLSSAEDVVIFTEITVRGLAQIIDFPYLLVVGSHTGPLSRGGGWHERIHRIVATMPPDSILTAVVYYRAPATEDAVRQAITKAGGKVVYEFSFGPLSIRIPVSGLRELEGNELIADMGILMSDVNNQVLGTGSCN